MELGIKRVHRYRSVKYGGGVVATDTLRERPTGLQIIIKG